MHSTLILTALFLAITRITAQNTEVPLFIIGLDSQPLVASIAGSDATATTYVISCSQGTPSDNCGVPGDFTVTEGPSTVAYTMDYSPETITVGCQLEGTTSALCTATQNGVSVSSDSVVTTDLQASDITFIPVTITAGGGVAPASATATDASAIGSTDTATSAGVASPTASATTSGASATRSSASAASVSKVSSLVTAVAGGTSTATGSGTASVSTAGMPRVTGKAGYVLGGAVAAAGLVLGGL